MIEALMLKSPWAMDDTYKIADPLAAMLFNPIARFRKVTRPADFGWSGDWSSKADLYGPKGNVVARARWGCIHLEPPSAASRSDLLAYICAKRGLIVRYSDESRKVRARGDPYSYRRTSQSHADERGKDQR